jgi:predicted RNase H-like HicB family nuclease
MKNKDFNVIIEKGEDGGYISEVVELPGCRSQGNTIEELIDHTKEAIALYLEVEGPEVYSTFVGLQKIEIEDINYEQVAPA